MKRIAKIIFIMFIASLIYWVIVLIAGGFAYLSIDITTWLPASRAFSGVAYLVLMFLLYVGLVMEKNL